MTAQPESAPRRWDLDWEPETGAGAPDRFPPSLQAAYAEFPLRAIALVIDVVLLTALIQFISGGASVVSLWVTRASEEATDALLIATGLVTPLAAFLITALAIYFWRVFRATPGQMATGLFVVRAGTGETLTMRSAVVRWLVLYAPLAPLTTYQSVAFAFQRNIPAELDPLTAGSLAFFLPLVWYVLLIVSVMVEKRRGRGLHDRLAGSVVVRRAGPPA